MVIISSAFGVAFVSCIEAITLQLESLASFNNLSLDFFSIDNSRSTNVTSDCIAFSNISRRCSSFPAKNPPSLTALAVNTTGTGIPSLRVDIACSTSISEKSLTPHSSTGGILLYSSPSLFTIVTGSGLFRYSLSNLTST